MDSDPNYEPIIGGHKSFSWEKELRERGLHASANGVAVRGDAFYEGPQGYPAPGSGSPRRDRVSKSPARGSSTAGATPAGVSSYAAGLSPRSAVGSPSPTHAKPSPVLPPQVPSYMHSHSPTAASAAARQAAAAAAAVHPPGVPLAPLAFPASPPLVSSYVSPVKGAAKTSPVMYASPPPAVFSATAASAHPVAYVPPADYSASPKARHTSITPGDDPNYEPIIGGHKSHSWEKELRERGLHASANHVSVEGDAFYEGPQGHPAPGSGSPRRNKVSASPTRNLPPGTTPSVSGVKRGGSMDSASPFSGYHGSPVQAVGKSSVLPPPYQPVPVARMGSTSPGYLPSVIPVPVAPSHVRPAQVSAAASVTSTAPGCVGLGGGGLGRVGISPPRVGQVGGGVGGGVHKGGVAPLAPSFAHRTGSVSPSGAALANIPSSDNDPSYEPIIGGHKSHSWEKELRERGLHASANQVAMEGDRFFEGPQGHPAPGSGSPKRDRVSASPPRR